MPNCLVRPLFQISQPSGLACSTRLSVASKSRRAVSFEDSDHVVPPTPGSVRTGCARDEVSERGRQWAGREGRAVSYTHLTLPTICSV
eukprot:1571399-Rhodomonas_salina.1